ncbi:MAG: hypothetical protein LC101_00485 [Flavobacteriales bacterium]|nr:hypothetical protein [Flavobacteriales bacterium]
MNNTKLTLNTIGTDAEFFLKNNETGEIVSGEGYIKGTKWRPFRFDKSNRWFTTQLDNVLAEITVPPSKTKEEFSKSVVHAIQYVQQILPSNLEPIALASAELDEKYLMTPQAMVFGCEPDFNAYTKSINPKPMCENWQLRSAGFHVHCGFNDIKVEYNNNLFDYEPDDQRCDIVQVLDLHISIPLVIMEPMSERKRLYGKAGAFRPKPYGLEYRTPSSFCASSIELMEWVFTQTEKAFEYMNTKGFLSDDIKERIQIAINTNNKDEATNLIEQFNLQLV